MEPDGLLAFLLARFAEDEAVARENWLQLGGPTPWRLFGTDAPVCAIGIDPRRVLAECEARRLIVELHAPDEDPANFEEWNHDERSMHRWRGAACSECGHIDENPVASPCPTLRLLARPYADHPDYRPEWRT